MFQFVPLNISTAIKYLNQNDAILQLYLAFKQSQQYIGFFYMLQVYMLYVTCVCYMLMIFFGPMMSGQLY